MNLFPVLLLPFFFLIDYVLRLAARVCFDVVNELIGERLHRLNARPGVVRSEQEVRKLQFEKRIALARRLNR